MAVENAEPGEVWETRYAAPSQRIHAGAMSAAPARRRLATMLTATPPFISPYGRQLDAEAADVEVAVFLEAFDPMPEVFAAVEPSFLASWGYLDGFCDGVLAIAAGRRLALLLNNGTD